MEGDGGRWESGMVPSVEEGSFLLVVMFCLFVSLWDWKEGSFYIDVRGIIAGDRTESGGETKSLGFFDPAQGSRNTYS
jgi:hypothetical protein